jgi:hypothetical protein
VPYPRATVNVTALFQEFSAATSIEPVPDGPCKLTQVLVYLAQVSTAAHNFIKVHYILRLQCLIRWSLKKRLQTRVAMAAELLNLRINTLVEFFTTTSIEEEVLIETIHSKLVKLDLGEFAIHGELVCAAAWSGAVLSTATWSCNKSTCMKTEDSIYRCSSRAGPCFLKKTVVDDRPT